MLEKLRCSHPVKSPVVAVKVSDLPPKLMFSKQVTEYVAAPASLKSARTQNVEATAAEHFMKVDREKRLEGNNGPLILFSDN
jgi:hypothetical protein